MSKLSIVNGECDHGDGNDNGYVDVDGNVASNAAALFPRNRGEGNKVAALEANEYGDGDTWW